MFKNGALKKENSFAEELEEMPLTPVKTVEKKPNKNDHNAGRSVPQINIF